jgi:hypothetical protein
VGGNWPGLGCGCRVPGSGFWVGAGCVVSDVYGVSVSDGLLWPLGRLEVQTISSLRHHHLKARQRSIWAL